MSTVSNSVKQCQQCQQCQLCQQCLHCQPCKQCITRCYLHLSWYFVSLKIATILRKHEKLFVCVSVGSCPICCLQRKRACHDVQVRIVKKNDVQDWQRLAEIREDLPKIIKKQTDEGWQGMLKIRKNIKKN